MAIDKGESSSIGDAALAGIYGPQVHGDPRRPEYDPFDPGTHRTGYNGARLGLLLEAAGFSKVRVESDAGRLRATATKLTRKGERQVAPALESIRADHLGRYRLASTYAHPGFRIIDAACGVGYGAKLLARCEGVSIQALDIDDGALEYAALHYSDPGISFRKADLTTEAALGEAVDLAISFETIEHLSDPTNFLRAVWKSLSPTGVFICSTPNEDVMPLSSAGNPYHFRHYRPSEFEDLLRDNGFIVVERFTQKDRHDERCESGWHGLFNIAVCRKA